MNNKIRAADAKEVGVGNPAEETYCYPNDAMLQFCNILSILEVQRKAIFLGHLTLSRNWSADLPPPLRISRQPMYRFPAFTPGEFALE